MMVASSVTTDSTAFIERYADQWPYSPDEPWLGSSTITTCHPRSVNHMARSATLDEELRQP